MTLLADGDPDESTSVVTDSNQRVERSFGRVQNAVSGVMTADEAFRLRRPVHDYTGGSVPTATTVAEYDGASLVTASSSSGYADILGSVLPEEHPYAAFDGSGFTAWGTAPFTTPQGQWIEVQFADAVDPGPVDLTFDKLGGADVASVRLTTDGGSEVVQVDADGRASGIDLPGTTTSTIRMTVVDARPGINQVRLTNFAVAGHQIRRSLRLPGEVGAAVPRSTSRASPPRRACVPGELGVACRPTWQRETRRPPASTGPSPSPRSAGGGSPAGWWRRTVLPPSGSSHRCRPAGRRHGDVDLRR